MRFGDFFKLMGKWPIDSLRLILQRKSRLKERRWVRAWRDDSNSTPRWHVFYQFIQMKILYHPKLWRKCLTSIDRPSSSDYLRGPWITDHGDSMDQTRTRWLGVRPSSDLCHKILSREENMIGNRFNLAWRLVGTFCRNWFAQFCNVRNSKALNWFNE